MISHHMIGKILVVSFDDHAIMRGKGEAIRCRAIGRLSSVNQTRIRLCHWELPDENEKVREANQEYAVILQSAIVDYHELRLQRIRASRQ